MQEAPLRQPLYLRKKLQEIASNIRRLIVEFKVTADAKFKVESENFKISFDENNDVIISTPYEICCYNYDCLDELIQGLILFRKNNDSIFVELLSSTEKSKGDSL